MGLLCAGVGRCQDRSITIAGSATSRSGVDSGLAGVQSAWFGKARMGSGVLWDKLRALDL